MTTQPETPASEEQELATQAQEAGSPEPEVPSQPSLTEMMGTLSSIHDTLNRSQGREAQISGQMRQEIQGLSQTVSTIAENLKVLQQKQVEQLDPEEQAAYWRE